VTMTEMLKKFISVTKPGVVFGNLITSAGGYFLAARGRIDIILMMATLIGISLVVASGCIFNNCIDRNLDQKMIRTRDRVIAKGQMPVKMAVFYASLLGMAGTTLLWAATNLLAVAIVLAGFAIYVGVYSLILKRNCVYASLVGSLAGAAPPLAGYCAVSGRFDTGAVILLSIFSLWQMPHCYAIAIFRFDDYAAASLPVLPVQQGSPALKTHIACYIMAFLAAALMLTFCGFTGYGFLAVAAVMGSVWLVMALTGHRTSDNRLWGKRLFVFSILIIFALSVMMSIDYTTPGASDNYPAGSQTPRSRYRVFNLQDAEGIYIGVHDVGEFSLRKNSVADFHPMSRIGD
jgi:heme o synthase